MDTRKGKPPQKKGAGKVTFVLNCIVTRWSCLITLTGPMNVNGEW